MTLIELRLPAGLEFTFHAATKEGAISTTFPLTAISQQEAAGSVGNNPSVSISVETRNGDIQVVEEL